MPLVLKLSAAVGCHISLPQLDTLVLVLATRPMALEHSCAPFIWALARK